MNTDIKQIVSKKDPLIQEMLDLKKTKGTPFYFVEGIRAVTATLQQKGQSVKHIFLTDPSFLRDIEKRFFKNCILVSDHVMDALSNVKTSPGLIALCEYHFKIGIPEAPGLICYDITDPGNLGTLFRTAAAFGAKSVICIGGVDPLNQKVIQASVGAIHVLSIYKMTEKTLFEFVLEKNEVVALTLSADQKVGQCGKNKERFIMVGNEAHGIPEHIVLQCSFSAKIAMTGFVQSLNAAIAGSIAMHELW